MNIIKSFPIVAGFIFAAGVSFAQPPSADLAINHNRLIREKTGDGVYKVIGIYKVVGTPYLFGEKNKGNLFSTEATVVNIFLSYNTYNQEVEFYPVSNPDKPLVKEPGEVDSFILQPSSDLGIVEPLKFIYGSFLNSTEKSYYQEVYAGQQYGIYKKYKSDLGYVSSNYIQSDLRQFDLECEYFYTDTAKKSMKKIKPIAGNVIKEFKSVKNLSGIVSNDAFTASPDDAFKKAFIYLNN